MDSLIFGIVVFAATLSFVRIIGKIGEWNPGGAGQGIPGAKKTDGTSSITDILFPLPERLVELFKASAHPQDLLGSRDFTALSDGLTHPGITSSELCNYISGDNPLVSCIVLEALGRRKTEDSSSAIIDDLDEIGAWQVFFALRAIHAVALEPAIWRVLFAAREEWPSHTITKQNVAEFIEERVAAGESTDPAHWKNWLKQPQAAIIIELLKEQQGSATQKLRQMLTGWLETYTDTSWFQDIGRLWDSDHPPEEVMVNAPMRISLELLEQALDQTPPKSLAVVGDAGTGKSALLRRLAERRLAAGGIVFQAGATDLLAGQRYLGDLERRLKELIEQLTKNSNVLWLVPNLNELLSAGRARNDPRSILDRILPHIESGAIHLVGETQTEAWEHLLQEMPRLKRLFEVVRVEELDKEGTLELAGWWADRRRLPDESTLLESDILEEAYQLAEQYLNDRAAPGNLMHLLELACMQQGTDPQLRKPIEREDLLLTVSKMTGLPASILDDRQALDLEDLRETFHRRVLGQPEAVDCLVERVALIKSGLTDPTRPAGVFLFAGPTGTGKTEIAKVLAEFLFGSPDRMIRLYMSEFQTPEDLNRLVGERGDTSESSVLLSRIRKQPFSVVLLDEFEKAHPQVWDLFLQVFDYGRLSDRLGNTADFRHSIIIMTSNLGSRIRLGSSIGFRSDGRLFSSAVVEKTIGETFSREFINRLDRVVIFRPLSRSVMRSILRKELADVLQRRGLRHREWALEWEETALEFLLEQGFTGDLGARPLKRAVERYLLSPLAMTIVDHQFPEGDQFLYVRREENGLRVEFIDPDADVSAFPEVTADLRAEAADEQVLSLRSLVLEARGTRREMDFLVTRWEKLMEEVEGATWQERKEEGLARMAEPEFWKRPERFRWLGNVEYMDRIESGANSAGALLERLRGQHPGQRDQFPANMLQRLAQRLYLLDMAQTGLLDGQPHDAILQLRAQGIMPRTGEPEWEFYQRLIGMYAGWGKKRRMRGDILLRSSEDDHGECILVFSGLGAYSILAPETGLHVFEVPRRGDRSFTRYNVRVRVAPVPDEHPGDRQEALEAARRILAGAGESASRIVRHYRENPSPLVRDHVRDWRSGRLDRVLEGDFDLVC